MKRGATSGLGVGVMMMAIAVGVAACEHEAQRQSAAAPGPAYFESAGSRPNAQVAAARATPGGSVERVKAVVDEDAPRTGRTDRFLWGDHANVDLPDGGPDEDAGSPFDAGLDGAPDAGPEDDAGPRRH